MRVDCVIVGGGISGLAAAHELHRRGHSFLLVESAGRYGGLIRTEHIDGFVVDAGPDALLTQKPAAIELCRELGVAVSPARSTRAFVAHRGRLRALPEAGVFGIPTDWTSFAGSRAFSTMGKLRMAGEYFLPPLPAVPGGDESIASFITRRFGREALQRLGEPLLAGIHGGDAARLSMRALFPRFLDLERTDGSVIRGLRRLRHDRGSPSPAPFVSINGGTETLITALIASLPAESLRSNVAVRGLEMGNEWRVHFADGTRVETAAVLLATPPRASAALVEPLDASLSTLLGRVRDVPLITVALGYKRNAVRHPLAGSGFVVPAGEDASVNAITWMSSKWMGRAPGDHVLLRASVGGARHQDASSWSDTDTVTRVRDDVRRYLRVSGAPVFTRMYRMPHAGVQLDTGHLNLIAEALARVERLPGLFISGAGIRGVGLADCIGDARAQAIEAGRYARTADTSSVYKERAYAGHSGS
jgi:oxygen-dependent protoporphyrinogen oxidase